MSVWIAALAAAVVVGLAASLLAPVRHWLVDAWKRLIGRPHSRLRIRRAGPMQLYWSVSPGSERRVVWQGTLLVTNDGNRVNAVVNGTIRHWRLQGEFGELSLSSSNTHVEELAGDGHSRMFLLSFTEKTYAAKPRRGTMHCLVTFRDRYDRKYRMILRFAEVPEPPAPLLQAVSAEIADGATPGEERRDSVLPERAPPQHGLFHRSLTRRPSRSDSGVRRGVGDGP
ncbi:MAG: hypothetical protein M0004_01500 [Actinomycetota bacterium]|nr:hypothetical protein [Actinomycetota bacterium]